MFNPFYTVLFSDLFSVTVIIVFFSSSFSPLSLLLPTINNYSLLTTNTHFYSTLHENTQKQGHEQIDHNCSIHNGLAIVGKVTFILLFYTLFDDPYGFKKELYHVF